MRRRSKGVRTSCKGVAVCVVAGLVGSGASAEARLQAPTTPAATRSAESSPPRWFRVFLLDGQVLAVVGEITRIEERVLVQVPTATDGQTRPVSLPARDVDWTRTQAYAESLRQAQFEQAGGARAYAAFTEEVAATLRDVSLIVDPLERIRRLEAARGRLAQWPAAHHGYRADDVAQTLSVVDDLLNGMRAAAGQKTFDLTLTSSTAADLPVAPPTLPPPTLQEVIAQALRIAPRLDDPADRLALLESAAAMLKSAPSLDRRWAKQQRRDVERQIRREQGVSRTYARLRDWMLEKSAALLAVADVRGLMRVRETLVERDVRLDRQRPAEVASLLATLDVRLDAARRHRLLLERWEERRPALERYAASVARHLPTDGPLPRALDEIRALAGPEPTLLAQAEGQLAGARADAGVMSPPDEAKQVQGLWTSALQLATRALQARRAAVRSGQMPQAWEASAAAAGALMLLQQLRTEVPQLTRPPSLPGPAR